MGKLPLESAASFVHDVGMSVTEVAHRCGVSIAEVRRVLKENKEQQRLTAQRREQRALAARARERTTGEVHDLNVLLRRVQRTYFPEGLQVKGQPSVRIRWGRDGHGRDVCILGSYTRYNGCVTIHPKLEHAPRCVIESTIYHELLHRFMGHRHSPDFRRRERQFGEWNDSERWLTNFNRRMRRATRRLRTVATDASSTKRQLTREELLTARLSNKELDTVGFGITNAAAILQISPYRFRKLIQSLGITSGGGYLVGWWSIRQLRQMAARL